MKKMLALLLVLMLTLSGTLSLAEGALDGAAQTFSNGLTILGEYSVNREVLAADLAALGVNEEIAGIVDTVASVIDEVGERFIVADNGVELAVSLKDSDVFTLVGELTDSGISLGSSLIPSYVLSLSYETIAKALADPAGQLGIDPSALEGIDFNAIAQSVSGYIDNFTTSVSNAIVPGEPEPGDYVLDGTGYNCKVPINVDLEAIFNAANTLQDELNADEALQAALKQLEGMFKGVTVTPAEPIPTDAMPTVQVDAYMNIDENGDNMDPTDVVFAVYPPDSEDPATMGDVFVQEGNVRVTAQFFDEADRTSPINVMYEYKSEDNVLNHRLDLYVQELYFGANCAITNGDVLSIDSDLYFLDYENPVFSEKVTIAQGGQRTISLDDGDKQVVNVEDLANAETAESLAQDLLKDLTSNGVIGMLFTAIAAMPDELGSLMGSTMSTDADAAAAQPAA